MFSTPVNTLEERAIFMRLLERVPHVVGLEAHSGAQHAPFGAPRQIVMVRANEICRRRFPSPLESVPAEGSPVEAGRGWRRGDVWDETDSRSIFERLTAAYLAGGLAALGADRRAAAVIEDAVEDTPAMTNGRADDARREVPALV